MSNKINLSPDRKQLIVYITLVVATFAVLGHVNQFAFVNFDDNTYITDNPYIRSGFTLDGFRWAFSTKYADLWNPLVWLSFMSDYWLFGLNAGGYHLTNLLLHILSTLLLFWLFNRMTGEIWKSAFVAALFALHPLHVESVAWVSERKDVLSAFFWMLTLYFYVSYTGKPDFKRYLPVLFTFALALMSKPMVVTLPVIMILLDYWPLKRFNFKTTENKPGAKTPGKHNLWLLMEKIPFMILSIVVIFITIYPPGRHPNVPSLPGSRVANAAVSFITYLEKTFWPHDMAVFYPFPFQIQSWKVIGAFLLIILISAVIIAMAKRLPCLFVGWFWYAITIAPVIGIIQISINNDYAMADRYHYIPSIGIAMMLAWGIPLLFRNTDMRKYILFPAAIVFFIILSVITFKQCGYWKNSIELWSHALKVADENYLPYYNLGIALKENGQINDSIEKFKKALHFKPDLPSIHNNLGIALAEKGDMTSAAEEFRQSLRLRPDNAGTRNNLAMILYRQKEFDLSYNQFQEVVRSQPNFANAHYHMALISARRGYKKEALAGYNKAVQINPVYGTGNYRSDFMKLINR